MIHNITDRERDLSKLLQNATQRINDLEAEAFEQARLLGMSGEHELSLRAKIGTQEKALKLALEALENSVDLVIEEARQAQELYGAYQTRQARVRGLQELAEAHQAAITAIREVLGETK